MALLRSTGDDGWARERGRAGLRHSLIAERCGRSPQRAKRLLIDMRRRRMIETQGNLKLDEVDRLGRAKSTGEAAEYRILPVEGWLARNSAVTPRIRMPALRMRARDGVVKLRIPGKGTTELPGEPEVLIRAGGRDAVTVTGAAGLGLQVPESARIDIAGDIELRAEKVPGAPATPLPISGEGSAQQVPGASATPPMNHAVIKCLDGHVGVWWPVGKRLTTAAERRAIPGMTVEEVVNLFAAAGHRAIACGEPREASPMVKRLKLDGPPTGTWERLKARIERSINAHTFSTWLAPTREAGTKDGVIIVAVPNRVFAKRIVSHFGNYIQTGLKEIGAREQSIEYRPADELEREEIPADRSIGSPTDLARKQHNPSQRRIA